MDQNTQCTITFINGQFKRIATHQPKFKTPRLAVIPHLIEEAARIWNVSPGAITGTRRLREATDPRFAVVYAARRMTKRSFDNIARSINGYNPSSMRHAELRAKDKLTRDPEYRAKLAKLLWNVRRTRRAA